MKPGKLYKIIWQIPVSWFTIPNDYQYFDLYSLVLLTKKPELTEYSLKYKKSKKRYIYTLLYNNKQAEVMMSREEASRYLELVE